MTEQKIAKEKMLTIDKELKKTNPVYITVDRLVSKMKLSVLAEKIIRAIASNIAEGNCTNLEDLSLYTNIETSINTKTFCEIFNYKNDNCFTNLADAREELQYTGFTLPGKCRPTDSLIAKSYVKNGNMYFQISPLVLPYYVGKGIDYELINIINFKNVNTFKFYEFLLDKLKNENEAIFTLSFEETKEMFHVAKKYERYTDFKNNVLKPILKDINEENYNKENLKVKLCVPVSRPLDGFAGKTESPNRNILESNKEEIFYLKKNIFRIFLYFDYIFFWILVLFEKLNLKKNKK